MAALVHGIFFGRVAPSSKVRKTLQVPALVVGHRRDPIHPWADAAMLAEEMPNSRFVEARSILEWRYRPARLNAEAVTFVTACWEGSASGTVRPRRRTSARVRST
jgi:pimeloyl-ACP methyl ester carboxylesterase